MSQLSNLENDNRLIARTETMDRCSSIFIVEEISIISICARNTRLTINPALIVLIEQTCQHFQSGEAARVGAEIRLRIKGASVPDLPTSRVVED